MQDLSAYHVRVGSMGELWTCRNTEPVPVQRGHRVVCRTPRGLEIGSVVSPTRGEDAVMGTILRRTTREDELLDARLHRYKRRAVRDCQQEIERQGFAASLMDIDHLFDGRTLIFYFLGEVTEPLQSLADSLVDTYEQRVRSRHFAKLLVEGCGPGCGTEDKGGCGTSGGCAVCVAATACAKPEG